jgi:deazaflavin-dependent oxidoreductase (nitroreductase family)
MSDMNEWNQRVIDEFRANDGKVGGDMEGWPILLLHHVGAKSGTERVSPVVYQQLGDSGSLAVFASKGGAPTNPDWYHNLKAHPATTVEVGPDTIEVVASEVTGEERERLYRVQVERTPQFGEYQARTERVIPVLALTPVTAG